MEIENEKDFGSALVDLLMAKEEEGRHFLKLKTFLLGGNFYLPEMVRCSGLAQPKKYHSMDALDHSILAALYTPRRVNLRVAGLFHDVGKPATHTLKEDGITPQFIGHAEVGAVMFRFIARRLGLEHFCVDVEKVERLIQHHMFDYTCITTDKAMARFIERIGTDNLVDQFRLRIADRRAGKAPGPDDEKWVPHCARAVAYLLQKPVFSRKDLAVNGQHLLELGFEGKKIGSLLELMVQGVVSGHLQNVREDLVAYARKFVLGEAQRLVGGQ